MRKEYYVVSNSNVEVKTMNAIEARDMAKICLVVAKDNCDPTCLTDMLKRYNHKPVVTDKNVDAYYIPRKSSVKNLPGKLRCYY